MKSNKDRTKFLDAQSCSLLYHFILFPFFNKQENCQLEQNFSTAAHLPLFFCSQLLCPPDVPVCVLDPLAAAASEAAFDLEGSLKAKDELASELLVAGRGTDKIHTVLFTAEFETKILSLLVCCHISSSGLLWAFFPPCSVTLLQTVQDSPGALIPVDICHHKRSLESSGVGGVGGNAVFDV